MRIYADESGTHDSDWLVIGMLFVPDHGALHSKLAKELDEMGVPRSNPRIREFKAARSWTDGNQCLQLADLLVGCVSQSLTPSTNQAKLAVRDHLYENLIHHGVREGKSAGYWRQFGNHVRRHHSKFSQWFWEPS